MYAFWVQPSRNDLHEKKTVNNPHTRDRRDSPYQPITTIKQQLYKKVEVSSGTVAILKTSTKLKYAKTFKFLTNISL